ncbi:MAG: hypothetical protein D6790_06455 [Caldilineae bacterium]|nr:MAG: hypothetical protein D6790_06455 [Caldilineae bacterium]
MKMIVLDTMVARAINGGEPMIIWGDAEADVKAIAQYIGVPERTLTVADVPDLKKEVGHLIAADDVEQALIDVVRHKAQQGRSVTITEYHCDPNTVRLLVKERTPEGSEGNVAILGKDRIIMIKEREDA